MQYFEPISTGISRVGYDAFSGAGFKTILVQKGDLNNRLIIVGSSFSLKVKKKDCFKMGAESTIIVEFQILALPFHGYSPPKMLLAWSLISLVV